MDDVLLAVDIGGTKCELALFPVSGNDWTPMETSRYASADYGRLEDIVRHYLEKAGARPRYASLGVAGVVRDGVASVTNLPWVIDRKKLTREFGFDGVAMMNDLTAVCASLTLLGPDDVLQIQEGDVMPDRIIGVVAPGTGLGEGLLIRDENHFFPRGSEGGHANFAPVDALQVELLEWMLGKEEQVSYESLIAGPGVPNLYDFFVEAKGMSPTDKVRQEMADAKDRTPVIFANGVGADACPLCNRVVETFLSILGSEAGNVALKLLAGGGIYIGGGIVPRIARQVSFSGFLKAFHAKGKMRGLMKSFPIHLILINNAALLGAARYGRELLISRA